MAKSEFQLIYDVAQAEVGYLEKRSNYDLDSKTGNAGYNNYTKYWRDIANCGKLTYVGVSPNAGFGGGPSWYWCAAGVYWCFVKALGEVRAAELLCHPLNQAYINCDSLYSYSSAKGQIYTSPKEGDVVLFGSNYDYSHTEWVYKVDDTYFYTIGFNTSGGSSVIDNGGGCCCKKYYKSSTRCVFHRPKYKEGSTSVKETNTNTSSVTYLKFGSKGDAVKTLQKNLNSLGYNCGEVDGDFGNRTLSAVRAFQKDNKLEVDGIVGPATTKAINNAISKKNTGKTTNTASKDKIRFTGVCTANGVNVRTWAGSEYGNIISIPKINKGREVKVLDFDQKDTKGAIWYYVRISKKYYGFVHSKYIKKKTK